MKITENKDIESLRKILSIARILDIDALVISKTFVGGTTTSRQVALISSVDFTFDDNVKIGIGRVAELEKRMNLFGASVQIECKLRDNEALMLTISEGKSKVQYRCTAERTIRYPKENIDPPSVLIVMTRAEAVHLAKAIRALGAEDLSISVKKTGDVIIECADSANELFTLALSKNADFMGDPDNTVISYKAASLITIVELIARGNEPDADIELLMGEGGSITGVASGYTILQIPNITGDEDE